MLQIAEPVTLLHSSSSGGQYENNPLSGQISVPKSAMKGIDPHGKGGGLINGKIVREFPKADRQEAA